MGFVQGQYKEQLTKIFFADYLSSLGGGERKYGRVLDFGC
jgi:hypothetical protein